MGRFGWLGRTAFFVAGRELAAEIEKVFEAKVSPDTLRKRAERMGGSNEPDAETPATTPKSVATSGYKPKPQEVGDGPNFGPVEHAGIV